MYFIKRFFIYVLLLLLVLSIYKDLSPENHNESKNHTHQSTELTFSVLHIKVEPGETVLSIVEEINNGQVQQLDMEQIFTDFKIANPQINDPHSLQPDTFYYFPLYSTE